MNARPLNGPRELYERLLPYLNTRPLLSNVPASLSKDVSFVLPLLARGPRTSQVWNNRPSKRGTYTYTHTHLYIDIDIDEETGRGRER